ncbi:3,4-dihydroxy-2-butanone-4-phosphate synthase, partial [Rhizobium ruizarguesonis]
SSGSPAGTGQCAICGQRRTHRPVQPEEAKRLNLNAMVAENDSAHTTAFTVSVDFKQGTTTGISADDRTLKVRNLANTNVGASDF